MRTLRQLCVLFLLAGGLTRMFPQSGSTAISAPGYVVSVAPETTALSTYLSAYYSVNATLTAIAIDSAANLYASFSAQGIVLKNLAQGRSLNVRRGRPKQPVSQVRRAGHECYAAQSLGTGPGRFRQRLHRRLRQQSRAQGFHQRNDFNGGRARIDRWAGRRRWPGDRRHIGNADSRASSTCGRFS